MYIRGIAYWICCSFGENAGAKRLAELLLSNCRILLGAAGYLHIGVAVFRDLILSEAVTFLVASISLYGPDPTSSMIKISVYSCSDVEPGNTRRYQSFSPYRNLPGPQQAAAEGDDTNVPILSSPLNLR